MIDYTPVSEVASLVEVLRVKQVVKERRYLINTPSSCSFDRLRRIGGEGEGVWSKKEGETKTRTGDD